MSKFFAKSSILYLAILLGGIVVGLFLPINQIRNTVADIFDLSSAEESDEPADDAPLQVEITETAQDSLGLKVRRADIKPYEASYELPAMVEELPGVDSIAMAARLEGLVTRIHIGEGESVRSGDLIFEMELTGESVATTQSNLLLAIQKVANVQQELDRLAPLAQTGGIAGKRILDLTYEKNQLNAEIETRQQELLLRGLTESQIETISKEKKLIRRVEIRVPENLIPPQINWTASDSPSFIVEKIRLKVGGMAAVGQTLCDLAFHETLVVKGHAFEKDLPVLREILNDKKTLTTSIGSGQNETLVENCTIAFISNHADLVTNTFPFYVYLNNQRSTLSGVSGNDSNRLITWKWKPGQRAHIRIPSVSFEGQIVLPRAAVAEDGASRVVFVWKGQAQHDHEEEEEDPDHAHEHADLFEPLEVKVVYMDEDVFVVSPSGNLEPGTRIAFNNANHLMFSMQTGGGGHHHGHSH